MQKIFSKKLFSNYCNAILINLMCIIEANTDMHRSLSTEIIVKKISLLTILGSVSNEYVVYNQQGFDPANWDWTM